MVKELFETTAPRFASRVGGYTRIIPFGLRRGDNAEMVYLELTEKSKSIISERKLRGAVTYAPEAVQDVATVTDAETTEAEAKPAKKAKEAKAPKAEKKAAEKKEAPKKSGGLKKLFKKKEDK
jgi:hypothetical protein